ncbi:MAG TPA: phosphoenolpyruvate--protein phosphotransferase [Candidatus Hypogeohydataceae bacterium YC41]
MVTTSNLTQENLTFQCQCSILNVDGLHARPATRFAKIANTFVSEIKVSGKHKEANGKSVIELLTLGAERGTDIRITAVGPDAHEAIISLESLVNSHFDEQVMLSRKGIALAPGVVVGKAYILENKDYWISRSFISEEQVSQEIKRLEKAFREAKQELRELEEKVSSRLGHEVGTILGAHRMILQDHRLKEEFITKIKDLRVKAEFAIYSVLRNYIKEFQSIDDTYLRERAGDILDIENRLLRILGGEKRETLGHLKEEVVLLAHDLTPSETAAIDTTKVKGFATEVGGRTSHTAILARILGIPGVVGLGRITTDVYPGDTVIIDGNRGAVIIRPDNDTIEEYKKKEKTIRTFESRLIQQLRDQPAETPDGRQIHIFANIDFPKEIDVFLRYGATGVGLYRTEYLFLECKNSPSEEDHYNAYLSAIKESKGLPLVIRTVDLGADKFGDGYKESNPFLGCRSIRYCFDHPELFLSQLKALLRASAFNKDLKVLFPLISSLSELRQAKAMLHETMEVLSKRGEAFNEKMPVGVMIEVPSSVLIADSLAKEADFFSIGTNDLVQYSLAIDRDNEKVASMYCPAHPAIVRLLKMCIEVADDNNIPVTMCGEMGSELEYIILLLGLGVQQFSVSSPTLIPAIKKLIRSISYEEAKETAEKVLRFTQPEESINYLKKVTDKIIPIL